MKTILNVIHNMATSIKTIAEKHLVNLKHLIIKVRVKLKVIQLPQKTLNKEPIKNQISSLTFTNKVKMKAA